MLQKRRELTTFHFCSSTELCAVHHMFTFCIILFLLSYFFFFFTHLPPFCCIRQRPCVNISKQMHFFSSFSTITWCLFSVLFYVSASGIKLHLTFFLWAINSYCMVLYQSLMYNICITFLSFATAVRWSVTIRDHFLLRGSLISSTSKARPGRNATLQSIPDGNAVTICSHSKGKVKNKNRKQKQGAGLRPRATCENMRAVSYSCHHIISNA